MSSASMRRHRPECAPPVRIALGREVEQCDAEALEVAGEVVDREVDQILLGTVVARGAIELGGAGLLEREDGRVEEAVEAGRGVVVDQGEAVELETAGLVDVDDQHGAEASLRVGHAVPGERGDRNAAVVLDRVDPGEARRQR